PLHRRRGLAAAARGVGDAGRSDLFPDVTSTPPKPKLTRLLEVLSTGARPARPARSRGARTARGPYEEAVQTSTREELLTSKHYREHIAEITRTSARPDAPEPS